LPELVRLLVVWAGAGCLLAWSGRVLAAEPEPPAREPELTGVWLVRAGFGFGFPVQSQQERLVADENFGGPRFHVKGELARMFSEQLGLGVRGIYGWRSAGAAVGEPDAKAVTEAPTYAEQFGAVAAELPVVFELGSKRVATLSLVPFVGPGWGSVGIYGSGRWNAGPFFGGEVELFVPRGHVGLTLGASFLPLPPPGRVGEHNDLGSYFISLILGADVH
jgi:hypothetical protein